MNHKIRNLQIIFLTYQNRSGSTFLANQLSRHNDILVCPEAEILVSYFLKKPNSNFNNNKNNIINIEKQFLQDIKLKHWGINNFNFSKNSNFENFINIITQYKNKIKPNANVIIFKSDRLINYIEKIILANNYKYKISFFALIRDPRAIFLSQKTSIGSWKKPMNSNMINSAINWNNFVTKANKLSIQINNFNIIKYEDLITNFNLELSNIFNKIYNKNISLEKLSLKGDLYERIPTLQQKNHQNINKLPMAENIDKWKAKLSNFEIASIDFFTKKILISNNYILSKSTIPLLQVLKFCYIYIKHLYIVIFHKVKSIMKTHI